MSSTKLNIKNISYLFNQNIFRLIISLFVGAWVARHLGVDNYGKFNFILSFYFLYKPLMTFGLDEVILSEIAKGKHSDREILGTTFIFRFIIFFLFYLLIIPSLLGLNVQKDVMYLTFLITSAFITIPFSNTEMYLNAKHNIKDQAKSRSLLFFILALLKVLFIYLNLDLLYFVIISTAEIIIMTLISYLLFIKSYKNLHFSEWKFNKVLLKLLLKQSLPVMISLIVFRGMAKIDQIYIAKYSTMNQLGLYSAASKLLDSWQFLPSIISTIYLSKMAKDRDSIKEYFCLLNIGSIGLSVGCYIFGDLIISLFYGEQYSQATKFLKLYSLQFIFVFYALGRINYFLTKSANILNLILATSILVLNLVFNYIFIHRLGTIGVIYASILSNILGLIIFSIFNKEIRDLNIEYLVSVFTLKKIIIKLI
ncbi:MAG: hypothetical protein BM556_08855 [Bacteriovorax sp. MedPE-SWde]|nr:MAG: hypothetical protein BM556_08855 [Bacteriovorax sp. MedPE-SWde]